MNAIMSSVEKRHLGLASGSAATMRLLGQMFSMGIVTMIISLAHGKDPDFTRHLSGASQMHPDCFYHLQRALRIRYIRLPVQGEYQGKGVSGRGW